MGILNDFGKKELIFTFGRYISYFFQIVKGFLLAKILGPELFGVFGVFMLIKQYLVYSNLGIQYALNIKLSVDNNFDSEFSNNIKSIINSSFTLSVFTSLVLVLVSILLIYLKIDFNYDIPTSHFVVGLLLVTILIHVQEIFLNVFRIKKEFYVILATEILISISAIVVILFFEGIELFYAVIIAWIIALLLSIFIFRFKYQYSIRWDVKMIKPLIIIGVPFLIYNFCFNLISMASRSVVAYGYEINEMGYFTFAVSLTTAIMLVFNSATWIIYPSLINKLSDKLLNVQDQQSLLLSITKKTISVLFILITTTMVLLPLVFFFFPEYLLSKKVIIILLINQLVINSGFALSSYLVGRNMFKLLIKSSIISLISCFILMLVLSYFKFDFSWIAFANLIGSFIYINYLIFITSKIQNFNYKTFKNLFGFSLQINLIIFSVLIMFGYYFIGFIFCFMVGGYLLKDELIELVKIIKLKIFVRHTNS